MKEEKFKLGDYTFSINKEESIFDLTESEIDELEIKTNQEEFEVFESENDFEFKHFMYAPEFYARTIPLKNSKLIVDKSSRYETAIYFSAHNFVDYELNLNNDWIEIKGKAYIGNKEYPFEISVRE